MIDAATRKVRAAVTREAQRIGATIDVRDGGRTYDVLVMAPKGMHWRDGAHELVASCNRGPWSYAEVWQDTLERMQTGTEPCTADCEWWGE